MQQVKSCDLLGRTARALPWKMPGAVRCPRPVPGLVRRNALRAFGRYQIAAGDPRHVAWRDRVRPAPEVRLRLAWNNDGRRPSIPREELLWLVRAEPPRAAELLQQLQEGLEVRRRQKLAPNQVRAEPATWPGQTLDSR